MERKDLLKDNGALFAVQGKAINDNANRDTIKVVVVGNPANTNALIAAANAPNIDPSRFSALTRLDHNRGVAQLADKTGAHVTEISRFAIWGNHSATQYPDISHTLIKGRLARDVIKDEKWVRDTFIPAVQQRGAAIINARGQSSAASAANAALEHIRDWVQGTNGEWTSMAVYSEVCCSNKIHVRLFVSLTKRNKGCLWSYSWNLLLLPRCDKRWKIHCRPKRSN